MYDVNKQSVNLDDAISLFTFSISTQTPLPRFDAMSRSCLLRHGSLNVLPDL